MQKKIIDTFPYNKRFHQRSYGTKRVILGTRVYLNMASFYIIYRNSCLWIFLKTIWYSTWSSWRILFSKISTIFVHFLKLKGWFSGGGNVGHYLAVVHPWCGCATTNWCPRFSPSPRHTNGAPCIGTPYASAIPNISDAPIYCAKLVCLGVGQTLVMAYCSLGAPLLIVIAMVHHVYVRHYYIAVTHHC
jgi:hypothetical protein